MAIYMMQGSYTTDGLIKFMKNPEDRGKPLEKLVTSLGGSILGFYYCIGEDDFVLITDMPDDMTALTALLAGVAPGYIKTYKTSKLFTLEQSKEFMGQAGSIVASMQGA